MSAEPTEHLIFDHTVEGLFTKALGARLTPEVKNQLRTVGIDLDRKLLAAYPFQIWMGALKVAADLVAPGEPEGAAMFKVGQVMIAGYEQTVMGKALLGMMRVLGPKRVLGRAQRSFRSANNYTETKLTEIDERTFELWVNHVGYYPTFTAGILHAGVTAAGAKNAKVTLAAQDESSATFRITWDR